VGIGLCLRDGDVPLLDGPRTPDAWSELLEDWSHGVLWEERTGETLDHLNVPEQGVLERLKGDPRKPGEARVGIGTIIKYAADGGCPLAPDDEPASEIFKNILESEGLKAKSASRLVSRRGSELTPKAIEWMWRDRFPRGMLSLLAGHGNGGKTTLLLDVAARITRGAAWPDSFGTATRGSVIYFSAEDLSEQTLLPRFLASGGEPERIHFVTAVKSEDDKGVRTFHLQQDLRELEKKVAEVGNVQAVIFDPISSYFGNTDTWRSTQVRSVLEPVTEFAGRCNVTILGNTHFTKAGKSTATMRILDSVAMSAVARAVYTVVEDADTKGRRLFLPAKYNLGPPRDGLAFTIDAKLVAPDVTGSFVNWESATVSTTADDALAAVEARDKPETALDEGVAFLRDYLADGPKTVPEVTEAAKQRDIAPRTLKRAKLAAKVKYDKTGMDGGWTVRLSE
jgi:putative DNA primase/helicase